MIIFIATLSIGISYFLANSFFGSVKEEAATVQTIDPITSAITSPDAKIFNDSAINPSVEVNINNTPVTSDTTGTSANSAN